MKCSKLKLSILMVITLTLSACQEQEKEANLPDTVRAVKVFTVADPATISQRKFPGQSASSSSSLLSFPVSGKVVSISFSAGQKVQKGHILSNLDNTSFNLDKKVAEAEYLKAKASYVEKKSDYDRKVPLGKKGWITRNEVEQSEAAMKSALQQLNLTQTKVNLAKNKVLDTVLTAPFTGTIAERSVDLYEEVSAGQQIAIMEGLESVEITIDVPEQLLSKVKVGQSTTVKFNALSQLLSGRVTEIASTAQVGNIFKVKVGLLESNPDVRSGMSAEVILKIDHTSSVQNYFIPLSSVMAGDAESKLYVYLLDPESLTLEKRAVTPTKVGTSDNLIAVSGVDIGDDVVSAGVSFLSDGLKVKRYQAN